MQILIKMRKQPHFLLFRTVGIHSVYHLNSIKVVNMGEISSKKKYSLTSQWCFDYFYYYLIITKQPC